MYGVGVAGPKPPQGKYGQPVAANLAVRHLCPNCRTDPPNIIEEYSSGDLVCGDCGTILGDRIVDTRSEWRTFAGDEGGDDPSRVGGPTNPLLGHQSLETSVSARDGRTGISRDLQRGTARANAIATNPGGRANQAQLQSAFSRIGDMCDAMQLPRSVSERAQHAYIIGDEARVARGKSDDPLIAACIIFACRAAKAERSFREVCKVAKVSKSELGKAYNALRGAVQASGASDAMPQGLSSANQSAEGLLSRFTNYLNLGQAIANASKHIAVAAVEKSAITGRSPLSIAAGVLYFTCILFENPTTSREIADIAEVSESTIKLICKKVAEEIDLVIRPEWKTQYASGYNTLNLLGKSSQAQSTAKGSRAGTPSVSVPASKNGSTPSPESKDKPDDKAASKDKADDTAAPKDKADDKAASKGKPDDKAASKDKAKSKGETNGASNGSSNGTSNGSG